MLMLARTIAGAAALVAVCGVVTATQSADSRSSVQGRADAIVEQLRELPPAIGPPIRSDGTAIPAERHRRELYEQLRLLGPDALSALIRGLTSQDINLRRNVALALTSLAGSWFDRSKQPMPIRAALPALIVALHDDDATVRAFSAQAIGDIGPDAVSAVPALVTLLENDDVGSRNTACIALYGIGPAARAALPALRAALADPNPDVRRFALRAIEKIQP